MMKIFSTTPLKDQHRKQSNDSKYKQKANVQSPPFKRKMADVLLLDPGHGLLVTVIKESPKSSNAQQKLFALLFSSNQMSNIKTDTLCFVFLIISNVKYQNKANIWTHLEFIGEKVNFRSRKIYGRRLL